MLGEHLPAVNHDIKDSARPLDQRSARVERLLQLGRQTGGPGFVTSNHAVGDLDLHRSPIALLADLINVGCFHHISSSMRSLWAERRRRSNPYLPCSYVAKTLLAN
jgi:hypothetical protein